jgi:5'-nucleotidase
MQAVGNHEFDEGPDNLAAFAAGFTTPLISCNVNASRHANLSSVLSPFVIKTLPVSGKKVALIGLTPPDTASTSSPGPLIDILPIETTLPGCIAAAKAQGAAMIVLLSHVSC